ncbi:MAG: glycosyltransferase family 4 protein [Deltaproteobacteria bacterium]|nr:glycosyltransferase family 4 protein [Deltaproteobacteria bacterium]
MTPIRVLLDATCVNDDAPTGASRYVQSLVRALVGAGECELHVFTFARHVFSDVPNLVTVSRLDLPRALGPVARETSRRRFVARAARNGFALVHFTLDPAPPLSGTRSVLTLFDIARRSPSFRAATGASLRALVRTHLRYGLAKSMDMLIATTMHAAREIETELPFPSRKIRVSPIATDPAFTPGEPDSRILARFGLTSRDYILFVGQMGRQKNEDGLLAAFRIAKRRCTIPERTMLAFAGDPSQASARTRDAVRDSPDAIALGIVHDSDLVHLYRGAVCLALPSFIEGYGLPVQEAMACGTPTIISADTCLVEIAGDAAIAVDPRSVEEMSAALTRLAYDRDLRDRLSRRGLERSVARTDTEMARAHLEAYRDALR